MTLSEKIAAIQDGKPNNLSFTFNEHWSYYESVEEADAITDRSIYAYISDEDRQLCIASNSVWQGQWYYQTPVGCFLVVGSSLEGVVDYLLACKLMIDNERKNQAPDESRSD